VEWLGAEPFGEIDKWKVVGEERSYAFRAIIGISARCPFAADSKAVNSEGGDITSPHFDGGMGLPAVRGCREGFEDLKGFDALLAEALAVKDFGGKGEVGIGEKGLNGSLLLNECLLGEPVRACVQGWWNGQCPGPRPRCRVRFEFRRKLREERRGF
jgi:hypothetical protein